MSEWDFETLIAAIEKAYAKESLSAYWSGEEADVRAAVRAIESALPQGRYAPSTVLGIGGSGVVIKMDDNSFPETPKALKFPRPVPGKVAIVVEMLSKEITYLAELRHPGVTKIVDYGVIEKINGYESLPYYLMDFISGMPSIRYCRDGSVREEDFRRVVLEAAKTLSYLHTRSGGGVVHLDLKPDNILIDHFGRPIIIDLGTCKRMSTDSGLTTVACTRSIAHPELVRRLTDDPTDDNRSKGEMPRSDIKPEWDLWTFGVTILLWLGVDPSSGAVREDAMFHRLEPYTRKYYMLLAARLLSYNNSMRAWVPKTVGLSEEFLKEFPVEDARELTDVLARLEGTNEPLASIPELSANPVSTIQAGPGVHVPMTKRLGTILEHRLFRRLSSINQLGLVAQVYPSAKHTRREHSLGTYANACRVIRYLYTDQYSPLFRQIIRKNDCLDLLVTALLHDIGQFPLAHDLEEIDIRVFSHTELTLSMLRGKWDIKKKGASRIEFAPLERVFDSWETTPDRIAAILEAKATRAQSSRRAKLLRSILSGPIDADKLDYLFRDARHTDVPYPLGVDIDRLYQTMTVAVLNKVDGGSQYVPTLAVHAKGKVAAEGLTVTRYAMFSQVYWHHTVRAQKAMLLRAVEALLASISNVDLHRLRSTFLEFVSALPETLFIENQASLFEAEGVEASLLARSAISGGTDLSPTDAAVVAWFKKRLVEKGRPEAELLDGILTRKLYKRLWVISADMEQAHWRTITELWDRLDSSPRHKAALEFEKTIGKVLGEHGLNTVTRFKAEAAKEEIEHRVAGEIPWLLIDIPGARPGSDVPLHYVREGQRRQLRKDCRAVGDLQESPVWRQYAEHLREATGKVRVFACADLVDSIETSLSWERGVDLLTDTLKQVSE